MSGLDFVMINLLLSLIALGIIVYLFISGKKLYSAMMKVLIIFLIFITIGVSQDDESPFIAGQRPLVPPGGIVEGTRFMNEEFKMVIDSVLEDDMWRQSAYMFLYGDNNTTKLQMPKEIII